jgi:hypothetical protein
MDLAQKLARLVGDIQTSMQPSRSFDERIAAVLCIPADKRHLVPAYTSLTDAAMRLVPPGWWWHVTHLEVEVLPTSPWPDAPISDALDYHFNGRPLGYGCSYFGARDKIALAVCIAALRARLGLLLKAKAKAEGRMYLVQTGNGPRIANVDGKLIGMPAGAWLDDDGKLIARKDAFPQYAFMEPQRGPEDEEEDRFEHHHRAFADFADKLAALNLAVVAADHDRHLVIYNVRGAIYQARMYPADDGILIETSDFITTRVVSSGTPAEAIAFADETIRGGSGGERGA